MPEKYKEKFDVWGKTVPRVTYCEILVKDLTVRGQIAQVSILIKLCTTTSLFVTVNRIGMTGQGISQKILIVTIRNVVYTKAIYIYNHKYNMVTIQTLELQYAASVVSSQGPNWCLNWEGGGGEFT